MTDEITHLEILHITDNIVICCHGAGPAVCHFCGRPCPQSHFDFNELAIQRAASSGNEGR